ncbi:MAG TPA: protein kinase [Bryobacteraceae bacterium]|nr:protein kinase [Bryobacteraceae bacterium]
MNARIEELFHKVADLPAEARTQYFAEHAVDEETRQEVEALLTFDSGASSFLQRDISIAASRALPQLDPSDWRCGPYRLLDVIGRGGMGAVYLAERADGEVTQQVAVKLLPPGAGATQRERFLQERQILASLTHPNIARMLGAGHVENGLPFLAMEYVEGKPIDIFCAGLSIRQKVSLILKVCAAVSYLHRNLIVHRDLKPSNILVTSEGEPRLLDFGIAKILDVATDSTMTSMRMLTPDYASPEQVTGGRISTATDIYSLGAVLYQLLTGQPAHEFEDHSPEAIARVVTTREVTRPSRWAPELKGDLEFILLKALRKDPQERYGTVEQLAEDLGAYLESRTVKARSGNAWYRVRKFLRRYWVPVIAAALVVISLSAGLYVANRQRIIAERRFGELHALSSRLLDLETEIRVSDLKLRNQLISLSIQYLEGLGGEALHDRALALEVSKAYLRVARNQGVPEWNQQGQYAEAEKSLSKANTFADSVLGTDPNNRQALWLSANVAHDRAVTAYAERRFQQVLAYSPQVIEAFDRLVRLGNLTRREINGATYMYGDLAEVHLGLHRFSDAVRYARLGIEISTETPTVPGPRAQAFNMLAGGLMYLGDFQGARDAMQESKKQLEKLLRENPYPAYNGLILSQTRSREGLILGEDGGVNLNRPLEAAVPLQEAFDAMEQFAQKDSDYYEGRSVVALAGHYLGDVLRHSDPKRALEVYDHSLVRIREVPNDVAARRLETLLLAGSSYAARWMHHEKDAKDRIDAALRLLSETKDYPAGSIRAGSEADTALRALADHYAETGQPEQALEIYQELFRKIAASNPDPRNDLLNSAYVSRLNASLAMLLRRTGKDDKAVALEADRLELWRYWNRKLPNNPFVLRQLEAASANNHP